MEKRHLRLGAIYQLLQTVSFIPFYAAVSVLIDRILNNPSLALPDKLRWTALYALAILLVWPVHGAFTVLAFAETQRLIRGTVARLRGMVVDQLQRMAMSYFTVRGSGALSNQMTVDLNKVENFLSVAVNSIVTSVMLAAVLSITVIGFQVVGFRTKSERRLRDPVGNPSHHNTEKRFVGEPGKLLVKALRNFQPRGARITHLNRPNGCPKARQTHPNLGVLKKIETGTR
jgi:ABC-type multidrug transport system fused ATPase/permease subunit